MSHRSFRRAPLVLAALAALTGCQAPLPGGPEATLPGGYPVPGASGTPANTTGSKPAGGSGTTTIGASGPIQLLDLAAGKPASFVTAAGKQMTLITSLASGHSPSSAFRLSVTPGGTGIASAYRVANAAEGAAGLDEAGMPYRVGYRQTALPEAPLRPSRLKLLEAATPRALGSEEAFWINSGDSTSGGDKRQTAVLKRITEHAYIYLDKANATSGRQVTEADLDNLAREFETRIYPKVTGAFGPEAKPGVDGDDRLFIVLSPAVDNWGKEKGLMGYFWSRDAIPSSGVGSHSNQKEALFMTDALFAYPALTSYGTLAHEFQHLINFSQKAARQGYTVAEETWLDEGMSMVAMEMAGYGLPAGDGLIAKDLNEFQKDPAAFSLTDWSGNPHGFAYGQSYLFVRYMMDRYGQGALKELLASNHTGVEAVEDVLAAHNDDFPAFFRAWTITNLISDTPLSAGTIYRYNQLKMAGDYGGFQLKGFQATPAAGGDLTANLRPWGTAYYAFFAPNQQSWKFNLTDGRSPRVIGAAIVP